MDQYFGMKEIYQVALKAISPMTFGNRVIEAGEPITYFNKMQIAEIMEQTQVVAARGGRSNPPHVIWEDRNDVKFVITQGVLSDVGFGLLNSARVVDIPEVEVPFQDILMLDGNATGKLQYIPLQDSKHKIFSFIYENGLIQKKVTTFSISEQQNIVFPLDYANKQISVEYYFKYTGDTATSFLLEKNRFNNAFCRLEGKFYWNGEIDGLNYTGLLIMPKVRITSNLRLRLGELADPVVSVFNITAMPEKTAMSDSVIVETIQLDDDIS